MVKVSKDASGTMTFQSRNFPRDLQKKYKAILFDQDKDIAEKTPEIIGEFVREMKGEISPTDLILSRLADGRIDVERLKELGQALPGIIQKAIMNAS